METGKINVNGSMHADGAYGIENNYSQLGKQATPIDIEQPQQPQDQRCSLTEQDRQPNQELPAQPESDLVAEITDEINATEGVYHIGMMTAKTANRTLSDALSEPDPTPLFSSLWFEGEIACMVGDTNEGKSILATQIAEMISKDKPVLLCDYELSDKQFQVRYTDESTGTTYAFSENLFRAELNPDRFSVDEYEERILADIRATAQAVKAQVVIIDNIGYLCSASEKAVDAGSLMVKMKQLSRLHHLSILVVAHTPKRQKTSPITVNDIAGSRRLANFFDSIIGLGSVAWDPNLRYIKQLKARKTAKTFGADNVLVYEIVKVNGFLQFKFKFTANEKSLLREKADENEELANRISDLRKEGKSIRSIAKELGMSKSQVGRMTKDEEDAGKEPGNRTDEPELPLDEEVKAE